MISPSGKFHMKFALVNFQFNKNDFTDNFDKDESGNEFSKKYRELIRSDNTPMPSTSGTTSVVTTDDRTDAAPVTDTMHKTPVKRGKKTSKRKTTTPAPEGAELPSPKKIPKPNTLEEEIQANYLGMLAFYST